jgi:hypothetical protein
MGDEGSDFDGCSNDQPKVVMHVHLKNHSHKSGRTTSKRNKYTTKTAQLVRNWCGYVFLSLFSQIYSLCSLTILPF